MKRSLKYEFTGTEETAATVLFGDTAKKREESKRGYKYRSFGLAITPLNYQREGTKTHDYQYNGKELNNDFDLNWNDYGARFYDPQIARWHAVDPLADKYTALSPFSYVADNPVNAVDPDGRYILFVNGLRLFKGKADQNPLVGGGRIHKKDVYKYWRTYDNKKNTFGRSADLVGYYKGKYKDNNVGFTSGSSNWRSGAKQRQREGMRKAKTFHKMVQKGKITLEEGETIKIVSHSQGGAHASGFADKLMSYTDADGNQLYNVEVVEYITPHQPTDFDHPEGAEGIQYSHPGDAVSSDDPWWLPNGGSEYGKIKNVDQFYGGDIMGGKDQPPCEGPGGNRCGHNVTDNDEFIKQSEGK